MKLIKPCLVNRKNHKLLFKKKFMHDALNLKQFFLFCLFPYFLSNNCQGASETLVGIYWGAFDPPTSAHKAIIQTALRKIPLKKIVVVVNNHKYKKYTYSLEKRIKLIEQMIGSDFINNIEILYQDDMKKLDYDALKDKIHDPLCAIAGYDAYYNWVAHTTPESRLLYAAIAVVPRGDEEPKLVDPNAFLLPIAQEYRYISSSKLKADTLQQ